MSSAAASVPDANALLCESCGYTLTGLPDESACPECGKAIAESARDLRRPAAWELHPGLVSFCRTTLAVLVRPARFYRTLATRDSADRSYSFAVIHWLIVSGLFGLAAGVHAYWYSRLIGGWRVPNLWLMTSCIGATYIVLALTTRLAAILTAWEASYRGLRMPINRVRRALHFHAPHYLPVAFMAAGTVLGYQWLLVTNRLPVTSATAYLYVLCGEVLVGAWYLFRTYWIGMRNIMYANA